MNGDGRGILDRMPRPSRTAFRARRGGRIESRPDRRRCPTGEPGQAVVSRAIAATKASMSDSVVSNEHIHRTSRRSSSQS
ncbi:hypothetical protein QE392_000152 [Microbacterium proteolyticum]|nr:hypothetical protein [Microbacterium sp. SORGH_AS_0344]MDQ1168348.1 hypothetical protein [Microbacterium proteolyticum]